MADNLGEFWVHDATLMVRWLNAQRDMGAAQWEPFNRLCDLLRQEGFSVGPDARMQRDFPAIASWHRRGRRGDLEFKCNVAPMMGEFCFFQNLVVVNSNGGEYDFDRRAKMPYLMDKRFQLTVRKMAGLLRTWGYQPAHEQVPSPNPDPLAYFNNWDGEYERKRGIHRFERREDGWPTDCEVYDCGHRGLDRDKIRLEVGCVRYFRNHYGRLLRGRCYPAMNNMWTVVYGPGAHDYTKLNANQLFQCDPRQEPRRLHSGRKRRLEKLLAAAVEAQNFERAIVLRDLLRREVPSNA